MEPQTLLKIARLRTLAARSGKAFDVVRFATDRGFALATLRQLTESDDEGLVVLSLEVMQALGMIRVDRPEPPAAPEAPPAAPPKAGLADRYVGRLR